MVNKSVSHWCSLFLALMVGMFALNGCDDSEPTPAAAAPVVEYRDRPLASVGGAIGVPAEVEPVGVLIFAEGTSHMAMTNDQGQFVLSGLPVGEYRLRAIRDDLESQVLGTVTVTDADLKKTQPFQELTRVLMDLKAQGRGQGGMIAADQYGTVRGMVRTDRPGEEGGVMVRVEGTPARTATLPDGSFELYRLEPGDYTVTFTKAGYRDASGRVTVAADTVTELPPVELSSAGEAAGPGRTIYGRVEVIPADGSTVTDLSAVRVVLEGTSFIATPGAGGRYQLLNLPPGQYIVSASLPGYLLEGKVQVDIANVSAAEANLTLLEDNTADMKNGSIIGRVILEQPPETGSAGVAVSLVGSSLVAFSDATGRYEIKGIEPGSYDMMATFAGYQSGTLEGVAVAAGAPTLVEDILLAKEEDAPKVVVTLPADGVRDVTIAQPTAVMIQFSQRMNPRSVLEAIRIVPEVAWRVAPEQGMARGQDVFYLELNAVPREGVKALNYGARYEVSIARSASSIEGVPMKESYSFSFTTGYPEIIATEPADGSRNGMFLFDEPIWIYFNAPIDRDSIDVDDITFSPDLPGRPNLIWKHDQETGWSMLQLQGRGEYNTRYRVTIGSGVRTITGQRVRNTPYRWTFQTRELKTFEDVYGTGYLDESEQQERERERH